MRRSRPWKFAFSGNSIWYTDRKQRTAAAASGSDADAKAASKARRNTAQYNVNYIAESPIGRGFRRSV
jgi:hypothetical protein